MKNLLNILNQCDKWDAENTSRKIATPFFINGSKVDLTPYVDGKIYSKNNGIELPFKLNGASHIAARKGYRPKHKQVYLGSFPNQDKFLIRFADGEVRVCDSLLPSDTPSAERGGVIISAAEQDTHYLNIALQGAGGGGSGSSVFSGGTGGAGGALLCACICVESPWKLNCGTKGTGGPKEGNATDGTATAVNGSLILSAEGGEGGIHKGSNGLGRLASCPESEICHCLLVVTGKSGGKADAPGESFPETKSESYGDAEEDISVVFPAHGAGDEGGGLNGGSGGGSAFGKGGLGAPSGSDGGNGEGYGSGGGGGGQVVDRIGGNGSDGCVAIYIKRKSEAMPPI